MISTEDVIALQQLMALYGHVADGDDLGRFREVFTPDAVFDVSAIGGEVHRGLPAIQAFFALGKPPHPPSHHTTNVHVAQEAGAVRVFSKWMVIARASGGLKTGDYVDEVTGTPGGWRIAQRVVHGRWLVGETVRMEPV